MRLFLVCIKNNFIFDDFYLEKCPPTDIPIFLFYVDILMFFRMSRSNFSDKLPVIVDWSPFRLTLFPQLCIVKIQSDLRLTGKFD